ncbi:MAG: glycoside hydrolase family 13 protein [Candidatus Riflebacteria bacterium]|nr:glycoside hydrolase family 13 protein [Candidatus Riflebacteria bacterium]
MNRLCIILFLLCLIGANRAHGKTTHRRVEFVPEWAKHAIWYQILPERFRNGDASNDPKMKDILGADPQETPRAFETHPWTSDWYKLQPYEKENGEKEMWKHLLRRRYGGDLQGIIDKLDYLHKLGINAIYLNPVFFSPSLHKYDGNGYHHIDPNFGPDPEGDRTLMQTETPCCPETWVWTKADLLALELIQKAHAFGIRVIFDGVFNHLGQNSFAFQDVLKFQQKSRYSNWFNVKSWKNEAIGTNFEYEGWFGVKSLPEFREDENGIVAGPRAYIFAATKRWMNPMNKGIQFGIDGWRLDVAFCVTHPFWKAWRRWVKSINPEAYLTAELVLKPEEALPYLSGEEFDAEMNYNFAFTAAEFLFESPEYSIKPTEFDQKLKHLRDLFPEGVAYVNMNLFGSHDSNRIGSHIVNRGIGRYRDWGKYYGTSKPLDNPNYLVRKPNPDEIALQKLFIILQMTYVGAPMIYYGDEVGMWGGNDPDCRKPMLWDDLTYEAEATNPDQSLRAPDSLACNHDLLAFYRKLIHIRHETPELRTGTYKTLSADDTDNIFAFERSDDKNQTIVILNNASSQQIISIPEQTGTFRNLIDKGVIKAKNELKVTLSPKTGAVLRRINP